jgi:branched-chain amino acid transport system substrate-binding protein
MKKILLTGFALGAFVAGQALAQEKVVKIGVLTDMSGVYADPSGAGSVVAAELAAEDSGLRAKGWKIEIISADHQNKADIASNLAREWIDQGKADVLADVVTSSVALAVGQIVKEKNKVALMSGPATSDLTGKACTPNTIHWAYDTYMLANGTGKAVTKSGGDSWYFITADYAFGKAMQRDATSVIVANGGKVLGEAMAPLNNADFSSQLLQAQSSKAKVVGLANAGADTSNSIKQAAEFGVTQGGQKLAALLMFITDVHALGLNTAQGLEYTTPFYWDLNDKTRAFSGRFSKRMKNGYKPTLIQAGVYSSLVHYLKTIEAIGPNSDGAAIVAKMKTLPTDDDAFGKGSIRADGRKIHPAYLLEVKKPSESKYPWDYAKVIATIPAEEAFRPLAQSECPLVTK